MHLPSLGRHTTAGPGCRTCLASQGCLVQSGPGSFLPPYTCPANLPNLPESHLGKAGRSGTGAGAGAGVGADGWPGKGVHPRALRTSVLAHVPCTFQAQWWPPEQQQRSVRLLHSKPKPPSPQHQQPCHMQNCQPSKQPSTQASQPASQPVCQPLRPREGLESAGTALPTIACSLSWITLRHKPLAHSLP